MAVTCHFSITASLAIQVFAAGPGDSFAEAALFSDVYHCDAVAETAARVVVIPKPALRGLLARRGDIAERLIARLARQVQDLRQQLELRNVRSANERVWQMLALAAGPSGGSVAFDGPLRHAAE